MAIAHNRQLLQGKRARDSLFDSTDISRLSGHFTTPIPEYRTTSGNNQMLITFVTDADIVFQGWKAIFFSDNDVNEIST